eukprot:Skav217606  [mRNA]  locus=scaffold2172:187971:190272:+ [translate_table: standard]
MCALPKHLAQQFLSRLSEQNFDTMEEIKQKLRYWLAWHASNWVYQDPASRGNGDAWLLDCGDGVEYQATVKLRMAAVVGGPLQFSSFDVEVTGGALTVTAPWKIYILAFRGTVTLQDWLTNLSVPINWDSPLADLGVGVHAGWHAYVSDRDKQQQLRDALVNIESDEILLAGHSLGGALAQIVMLFLCREHETLQSQLHKQEHIANHAYCITFGSPAPFAEIPNLNPRVKAKKQREKAKGWMKERCVNFVNNNDPVPRLPFAPDFVAELITCRLYQWRLPEGDALTQQLQQQLVQVVRYKPRGDTTNMPNVRETVEQLREEEQAYWLQKLHQTLHYVQSIATKVEKINAEVSSMCVQAQEARRLHTKLYDQFTQLKSYMQAVHNSVLAEQWADVEQSFGKIHCIIEDQISPAIKELHDSAGELQAFYQDRLAQPVQEVSKLTTDLHSFTGNMLQMCALSGALILGSGAVFMLCPPFAAGSLPPIVAGTIKLGTFTVVHLGRRILSCDSAHERFTFWACLTSFFFRFRKWAEHLIGESKDFEDRMMAVEEILKDSKAEDTYQETKERVDVLSAQAWELLSAAKAINHAGVPPEVVEQKKQEVRELGKELLERAGEIQALMGEADRPRVPELELPPLPLPLPKFCTQSLPDEALA